jgi:DNA polymerase III subunit gamma/tau
VSLDIKYRPTTYDEVLGQEATKTILRRYVSSGKGFQQSYLLAGQWGSGKTTLGRILVRALLCDNPQEGAPCNECSSCASILESGSSDCFTEVDAATNSGKSEIKRLTGDIDYDTFSGKRRIYLFDEAHQLSKDALDALLKPLEDNIRGSSDKKLVCIFCTTEPEKMRDTVLSRCAPAFTIDTLPPEVIAERLAYICEQEGIETEEGALQTIATVTECHIRDALKAVEGVSMLGGVTQANVAQYLQLDQIGLYLTILKSLGIKLNPEGEASPNWGLAMAYQAADLLLEKVSPTSVYQRLAEASMVAYQVYLGAAKAVVYWQPEKIKELAERGDVLLGYASRFSAKPGRPTGAMLKCDIAALHHGVTAAGATTVIVQQVASGHPTGASVSAHTPTSTTETSQTPPKPAKSSGSSGKLSRSSELTGNGVHIDHRAVAKSKGPQAQTLQTSKVSFDAALFARLLVLRITELDG